MDKTLFIRFSITLVILNARDVMSEQFNGSTLVNSTELNNEPGHNQTNTLNSQQIVHLTDVCERITRLDDTISRILDAVPRGGGKTLFDYIRSYNTNLNSVLDYLKFDKETTKRVAEDILKKGSAKYLAVDTVEEMLRRWFQWTKSDFEIFKDLRHDTIESWYDIITVAFKDEDY